MTDYDDGIELPNLEEDLEKLQEQLSVIPDSLPTEEFSVLAKNFFDLPPKTSVRKAEVVTGIRRKRVRKILDSEVVPTDEEVSLLTDFIMKELDLLGVKRQKRLAKLQEKDSSV